MPAPEKLLQLTNVTKRYDGASGADGLSVLTGVSFVAEGEATLAIVGPSGSGKSTLLTLLGGVDVPTTGQVLLEGKDLAGMTDDERTLIRRRRIGFVFQAFNLLPILTAEENVSLPLELDGVSTAEASERAAKSLKLVGLTSRRTHLPGKLSGGEQQRVAIARALVIEPAILLADEPTGNLDSNTGKRITAVLRELVDQHGQTIVMVTHDPAVAEQADRVIHLSDGRVEREEMNRPSPIRPRRVASEHPA
jgi:putative ABC transport system ATP-binding protein